MRKMGMVGKEDSEGQKRRVQKDSDWAPSVVRVEKMAYIENERGMTVD